VTNDLKRRVGEHKDERIEGFAKRCNIMRLVYCEAYRDIRDAILREKRMKAWKRDWKIRLTEKNNPEWRDLYDSLQDISWMPAFAGMTFRVRHFQWRDS
jgi:putative endonuclease